MGKQAVKLVKIFLYNLLLIAISNLCYGQSSTLGSWNMINIRYNINEKWSVFGEAQLRSFKFYNNFFYHEYKGAIEYEVSQQFRLALGIGDYDTYNKGGNFIVPKINDEFRIWPQILLLQSIGKFKIEHRYRSEFRFTSNGYRNRFRYRPGVSYPFGKEINGYKPYQVSASNELFFSNLEPYFERNRMLLAFSYKPSKTLLFQLGYLYQFDYKIDHQTGLDFLQVGLFVELFRKNI